MWEALFKLVHSNTSAKSIRWNERRTSLTAAQSILCMCWTLVMKGRDLISDSGSPKVFAVSVFPHTCSWFSLHHLYLTHCSVVGEDEEKMPSLYNQSCSQLVVGGNVFRLESSWALQPDVSGPSPRGAGVAFWQRSLSSGLVRNGCWSLQILQLDPRPSKIF